MISSQRTHVLLILGYVMLLDVYSDPTCIQAAAVISAAAKVLSYNPCSVEVGQCALCFSDGSFSLHLQPLATPCCLKAVVKRVHLV